MNTEELQVLIRTTADTKGATQTSAALERVQQQATNTARATRAAQASTGGMFRNAGDAARFATALTGVSSAADVAVRALAGLSELVTSSITVAGEATRVNRTLAASYGSATPEITRFADALARTTNVPRTDVAAAAINARTLGQNYGFSTGQIEKLIERTNDLAVANGMSLPEAFQRVQSAMRGEAESAEALGLVLNANFIAERQRAAGVKESYFTLTQAKQAQVIYTEFLRQSAQFAGTAATATGDLDRALAGASTSATNFQTALGLALGPATQDALRTTAGGVNLLTDALQGLQGAAVRSPLDIVKVLGITAGTSLFPQQIAAQARRQALALAGLGTANPPGQATSAQLNAEAELRGVVQQQLVRESQARQRVTRAMSDQQRQAATLRAELAGINDILEKTADLSEQLSATNPLQGALAAVGDVASAQRARQAAAQAAEFLRQYRATLQTIAQPGGVATQFGGPPGVVTAAQQQAQEQLRLLDRLQPVEEQRAALRASQLELQQRSVELLGQQAQLELQLLPARQQLVALDQQLNNAQTQRLQLLREQAALEAQQRAAPAREALEDVQAQIERNQLIIANRRGTSAAERAAARRENRELNRQLPGLELTGFDAQRALSLQQRAGQAADIVEQLRQNRIRQQQATVQQGLEPGEAQLAALQAQLDRLGLVGRILDAAGQRLTLQIQVEVNGEVAGSGDASGVVASQVAQAVFEHLTEANGQAQLPPVIPVSAVRRG